MNLEGKDTEVRAIIVGGGIAGPATALALSRVGVASVVLEAAGEDRAERGSWFTISPNGLAALDAVGALDAVRSMGVPTRANRMMGATGRELGEIALGRPLSDGTPALSFKRPRLAVELARHARHQGIEVRLDARVVAVESTAAAAMVQLASGERLSADLVIGADGIHSIVRRAIDPAAPTGRFLGLANFGGMTRSTPIARSLPAETWTFVFGRRAFFGALPTPAGDVVWFVNEPRRAVSPEERASTEPSTWRDHLAALAANDEGPFAELIGAGELELAGDNTYDLPRVPTWHRDRLALVGDAIHAPAPSSGQGASMALEDAVELAAALRLAATPQAAFEQFESRRRQRVERIVADGARSNRAKTAGPVARVFQDAMLRLLFRHVVTEASQAWVYDYRVSLGMPAGR